MASGVNVKMGVTGISQFRQNINTAKQSLKTLDAQLALNEKQFKQTGDAETYMQQKSELLKVKLEEQKAIAANCEKALQQMTSNGVDKASKAFQDMQRQLLEAKGGIIDTETAMQGLVEAGDDASNNVSEMNSQLKQIGKGVSFENVTNGIGKITDSMEKAFQKAIQLGKAIVKEVLGAGSWADDLATRSTYYGISEEALQRMEKTATLIDTPVEAIINAQKRLKKETAARGQETMGAFAALGINPDDAKDAEDLFWRTGEAIMRMGDEFEQEAYAQKLFGRSWNELIPLFQAGRKEYDELNESWNVVPQEQLDALKEMDDQYQRLNNELQTVKMTFLGSIAPALTGVMGTITNLLEKFNEYLASPEGQAAMQQLGETISKLVEDLVNVDPDAVVNGIAEAINSISDGLNWVKENKDLVVNAIKAVAGAFALLKAGELAINIWKVVDGLKHLGGGGGINGGSPVATGNPGVNATGGGSAFGATLKTGLGNVAMLGAELLPVLTLGYEIYDAIKWVNESTAAGNASIARFGEMSARYGNNSWFQNLSDLYGYQHISENATNGADAANNFLRFADEWQKWMYEGAENPLFDRTLELMDPEVASRFLETMDNVVMNPNSFDRVENYDTLEAGLEAMEQAAEELSGEGVQTVKDAGKEMSDAADKMSQLPKETAAAVASALNGTTVVIDGAELTGVVGSVMAGVLARYTK